MGSSPNLVKLKIIKFIFVVYPLTALSLVGLGWFMVFNATFNNISVISWRSVLLVKETDVPGENHRLAASH
jgi:cell division septal protein FtsQ